MSDLLSSLGSIDRVRVSYKEQEVGTIAMTGEGEADGGRHARSCRKRRLSRAFLTFASAPARRAAAPLGLRRAGFCYNSPQMTLYQLAKGG